MKNFKKSIGLILIASMMLSVLAGCSGKKENAETEVSKQSEESKTVEITDLDGNKVEVKDTKDINKYIITAYKGAMGSSILLGQLDKVQGMSNTKNFPWIRHAFPKVKDIKDYGSFDEVNTEEVLKDNPDVVISPKSAAKANEQMKSLGVPVLIDGIDVEDSKDVFKQTYDEIDLVAKLTGSEDTAKKYYEWADETFKMVEDRVKDIKDEDKVKVLPIRSDILQVFGNNCIWGYVVEMAGGVNLSGESTKDTGKFFADVDAEQIVKWNPDIMFQINFNGALDEKSSENYNNWAKDERFSNMKALKSGDLYLIPTGIDYWSAAIEAPICVLWMADMMYPEKFEDIDVKKYTEDFYKEFLDYEMNDSDWEVMAQQYNGAKNNGSSK